MLRWLWLLLLAWLVWQLRLCGCCLRLQLLGWRLLRVCSRWLYIVGGYRTE